jgi:two-component system response regulator DesR
MCRLHAVLMRSAGRAVRSALPLPPRRAETAAMNDEAAEPGAVIRVLVAEDTRILRETLVTLFSLEDGIEVVAQVAAGTGIVPAALEHRPDVALLDIGMPGADGLSAAAELSRRLPGCKVVVLTALETPDNRRRAAAAGVSVFLLKGVPAATLIDAVRSAARQAGSRRPG